MIESYKKFRERLASFADDEYREFVRRGVPSERPFVGVRIPRIREIVGKLSPEFYKNFLDFKPIAFEEVLARGMVVAKLSYSEMLQYFDSQVSYIDDWCTCDTFCSEISKKIKTYRAEFLDLKIEKLLNDSREFAVRTGLVLLKCAYVDFDYLALIFDRAENLRDREEYYIIMAVAWLIAECFIKYPEETYAYLKVSRLPAWTFNKTISKICDSHRIESEIKNHLRELQKA